MSTSPRIRMLILASVCTSEARACEDKARRTLDTAFGATMLRFASRWNDRARSCLCAATACRQEVEVRA